MKKVVSISAVILLIAVCLIVLTGCGATKMEGKYELVAVNADGVSMEGEGLAAAGLAGMYFEFTSDTDFKMGFMGESEEGKYTVDGDKITLTINEEDVTGTIDGKKFTIEQDGAKMTFEKK